MFWLFMDTKNNIKNNTKNVIIVVLKFYKLYVRKSKKIRSIFYTIKLKGLLSIEMYL